jgi:hypothetical protein
MTTTYTLINGQPTIAKDPNATLDYSISFVDWLALTAGDTLATVTWTVSSGLSKGAESNTTTAATVWLSSGVLGATEWARCHFTTTQGRIDDCTIYLKIQDK